MVRYTDSSNMVSQTMHKSLPALFLLLFFVLLLTTVFGTLVFFFEVLHNHAWCSQPSPGDAWLLAPTRTAELMLSAPPSLPPPALIVMVSRQDGKWKATPEVSG